MFLPLLLCEVDWQRVGLFVFPNKRLWFSTLEWSFKDPGPGFLSVTQSMVIYPNLEVSGYSLGHHADSTAVPQLSSLGFNLCIISNM